MPKPRETVRFTFGTDCGGRIVRRCMHGVICGERGCKWNGNPRYLPDDMDRPSEYYCWRHMRENGYCPGCGNFWAGVESFDFSRTGYCENCAGEFEEDDYSDEPDYGWFDPFEEAL